MSRAVRVLGLTAPDNGIRDMFTNKCPFIFPTGSQSHVRKMFHAFMML
jgi:hypothetical protein